VIGSSRGRVDGARGCPTIGAGVVPPAGIAAAEAAPDNHFASGPHRCVSISGLGLARGRRPRIVNAGRIPAGNLWQLIERGCRRR